MSFPQWINADSDTSVGTATIESDDNLFTISDHGLSDGVRVVVSSLTGGASGVIADGGVYWVRDVSTDTFALSETKLGLQIEFASDGGADVNRYQPSYNAQTLRHLHAAWLYGDDSTLPFQVRAGVRPNTQQPVIDLTGTSWTMNDVNAVVTTSGGAYIVAHPEETGALLAADGVDDRIDAFDLQIKDHDEDASNERLVELVYVPGTPASVPSAPSLTTNSLRLATVLVPAGGSPNPSIATEAVYTVAAGGVLPLRDSGEEPDVTDLTDGTFAYRIDTQALRVSVDSSSWGTIGNTQGYQFGGREYFTIDGSFDKGDHPGLRAVEVDVIGGGGGSGGAGNTVAAEASEGAGGGGGGGARKFILASALSSSESVTVGAGGNGASAGANNGGNGETSSFGSHCSATGGTGGEGMSGNVNPQDANHGQSGLGSNGDLNLNGDDGGNGRTIPAGGGSNVAQACMANIGGASAFGYGGRSVVANFSSDGQAGQIPGGGAAGARNNPNESARAGQDGARGVVIVTLYF